MKVNDKTMQALEASLKMREMRQEIISSNIANADTPNYKAKRVDFENALARAIDIDENQTMKSNNSKHFNVGGGGFDNLEPEIYEDPNDIVSEDGNTVDTEQEMAKMAQNKILYDATVKLMKKKLGLLKYAISAEK